MGNHSSNNSSHLNASSADAPPVHASAVHSAAARRSAAPARSRPEGSTQSSGASASASGKGSAGIAQQVTAASASSSLSGRKRSAAAESVGPSAAVAAAAAASAPSSEQSTDSASNASQSKKQRGESSSKERNGPSAAAAASSVGIDPLPAASRRPAASSAAASSAAASSGIDQLPSGSDESSDNERSDSCDDERSDESDDGSDEEQEWRPAAHTAAASAAESSSSRCDLQSQPEESADERRLKYWKQQLQLGNGASWVPVRRVHVFDAQRLCAEAQRLIRGVLSFAETEVRRCDPAQTAAVRGRMRELQAAEAELQSMDALPLADHANQRAVKRAQIEELTEWIKSHGGTCAFLRTIDTARAVTERQPADIHSMESLGRLCFYLLQIGRFCPLLPADRQEVFRSWLLRVDSLFTRLCESAPYTPLTQWQSQVLWLAALHSGAFQLVSVLNGCDLSWPIDLDPFLATRYLNSQSHVVCLQPYLRLFEYGLDPTRLMDGLSPLQLARNFVRDHPPPAMSAPEPMASMQSALDETGDVEHGAIPSVLAAYAIHHQQPMGPVETARRAALHARFMHATIPAWRSHSDKVRSLLLAAAPGRLIPPLVNVVSRYLDLEGVRPERSVPVDDAAEMD